MIQITLTADNATELGRVVYDLNAQLNPEEASRPLTMSEAISEAIDNAPAAPRTRRTRVAATARPGPAGEVQTADAPAGEGLVAGALGRPEGESTAALEATSEDHREGDATGGDGGDAGSTAMEDEPTAEVPTFEACEELARRLAQEVNFGAVQEVFGEFGIRKFGSLPPERYADFAATIEARLALKKAA